jgi:hypothetical protein
LKPGGAARKLNQSVRPALQVIRMPKSEANPYSALPPQAFWRSAVADKNPYEMTDLWDPKFPIKPRMKVATFGSCFAQHVGRALRKRGYHWFITEAAPQGMSESSKTEFNYELFTCRTGNIYTASLLRQWVEWSLDEKQPPAEYWTSKDRYIDPFRPRIEPDGFESLEEMLESRRAALAAFRQAITEADIFVFTLGLTESWFNKAEGYEYPMCPGTAGGTFDPDQHVFYNQEFAFIQNNLREAINKIRSVNKGVRFLFTVSPVPLTATNSGNHVMVATMESKSILRAVAAQMTRDRPKMDYYPSYEIVNSPVMGGRFFEPNQRNVSMFGVNFVMDALFAAQRDKFGVETSANEDEPKAKPAQPAAVKRAGAAGKRVGPAGNRAGPAGKRAGAAGKRAGAAGKRPGAAADKSKEDVVCEEALLEAFGS